MPAKAKTEPGRAAPHRVAPHVPRPPWGQARPAAVPLARDPEAVPAAAREAPEHEAPSQLKPAAARADAAAPQAEPPRSPNRTGLPDGLKAGVEGLSGLAMDDVRVHRDSPEPAKLGALAYTQGSDIHLGPGQEEHLPHEAWHVVQQKQGRVAATAQLKGLRVNEDQGLENEADRMSGGLGAAWGADGGPKAVASGEAAGAAPRQKPSPTAGLGQPVQLQKGGEKPRRPAASPIDDLSRQRFWQYLERQRLNEQINGAAAKALASAYLSAQAQAAQILPTLTAPQTYITTTPTQSETPPAPPDLDEVYEAVLSLMDVAGSKNAGVWKWTPAPKKDETAQGPYSVILDWAFEQGKEHIEEKVQDKVIETIAAEVAGTWQASKGLEIVVEIFTGVTTVVGWFTLAISVLELLNQLKKSGEKSLSRQEQIIANVRSWLTRDAQPVKTEPDIDISHSYRDNVRLGGIEDRIRMQNNKLEGAKAKNAAASQKMKAFEAFQKSSR